MQKGTSALFFPISHWLYRASYASYFVKNEIHYIGETMRSSFDLQYASDHKRFYIFTGSASTLTPGKILTVARKS